MEKSEFFFCPEMDLFQLERQDTGDFSTANFIDLIMVPVHLYCSRPVLFDINATINYLVTLDRRDERTLKGHAGSVELSRVVTSGFQ